MDSDLAPRSSPLYRSARQPSRATCAGTGRGHQPGYAIRAVGEPHRAWPWERADETGLPSPPSGTQGSDALALPRRERRCQEGPGACACPRSERPQARPKHEAHGKHAVIREKAHSTLPGSGRDRWRRSQFRRAPPPRSLRLQPVPAERDTRGSGLVPNTEDPASASCPVAAGGGVGRRAILKRVGYDLELAMKARQNRRSG